MRMTWVCPLCGNKNWIIKRYKMWDQKIFRKKKLLTCANCRCSSMHPMPTKEELKNINKIFWSVYSIHSSKHRAITKAQAISRVHYINKFIEIFPTEKVLDIGSGYGNFLDALKQEYSEVTKYYAIEPDKTMKNILYSKGAKKVFTNIDNMQEKDFSLIIMSHILEHLSNPRKYLAQVIKYMKDDAILFLEVPNRDDLYKESLGLHTFIFNSPCLTKLIKDVGFHIIDITTAGCPIPMLIPKRGFFSQLKKRIIRLFMLIPKRIRDYTHNLFEEIRIFKFKLSYKKITLNEEENLDISSLMLNSYGRDRRFIRVLARN